MCLVKAANQQSSKAANNRAIALFFAALLFCCFAALGSAQTLLDQPVAAPRLTIFASEHYHIHSNLPRREVVPFGRHMDAIFEQYQRRFTGFTVRNGQPMPLYLFRTQSEYLAFMASNRIDARNSGGMFFVTGDISGLATWVEGNSRSRTMAVLQHEGFHQFAWRYVGPKLPVWLNEGLAQYFEDAVVFDNRMVVGLANGRRVDRVRQAIDDKQTLALIDLLALTGGDWQQALHNDPAESELLYAQTWSLAYFLIHGEGGKYQPALSEFLRNLSRGDTADRAFGAAFRTHDLAGIESGWRAFASQHQPDPINAAAYRMEFLGTALRFLNERNEPMPRSVDELRRNLQARGFTVTRQSDHRTDRLEATDNSLYHFERDNGTTAPFELLESSRIDLPPRILAPGLRPEPMLIWTRSATGELVQDIEYR